MDHRTIERAAPAGAQVENMGRMQWTLLVASLTLAGCASGARKADSVVALSDSAVVTDTTTRPPASAPVPAPGAEVTLPETKAPIERVRPAREVSTDAEVHRLESRALSMVRATGCTSAEDCRSVPVGSRACGGPRTYLVYCRTSTDSVALHRVLDELARAERAANERSGMASTCDFRMPPSLGFVNGRCVSK